MKKSWLILVSISICSCAVTSPKSVTQLKDENKAIVLGVTENFLKDVFVPIGTKTNLRFLELNGNSFGWSVSDGSRPTRLELVPGKHNLKLICSGSMDTEKYEYVIPSYDMEVEAGHIYQMKADPYNGGCNISHEDVTNKS